MNQFAIAYFNTLWPKLLTIVRYGVCGCFVQTKISLKFDIFLKQILTIKTKKYSHKNLQSLEKMIEKKPKMAKK